MKFSRFEVARLIEVISNLHELHRTNLKLRRIKKILNLEQEKLTLALSTCFNQ